MIRVKYLKDHRGIAKGTIVSLSNNEAFGLIDSGIAIVTRDMTPDDYKQAGEINGKSTQLRANKSK